jgi:uncharacterized protein (DUF697 family)
MNLAQGDAVLVAAVQRCRRRLHRRALMAAAAGSLPIPGLDWMVDAALLAKLIPEINAEFGLTPDQIAKMEPHLREQVQKAVAMVGSLMIGKFITRDLLLRLGQTIGLRLSTQQAAKFVPLAGHAASALLAYTAIRYLGEEHLKDCVRVSQTVRQLLLAAPPVQHEPVKPGRSRRKPGN